MEAALMQMTPRASRPRFLLVEDDIISRPVRWRAPNPARMTCG
jgi:hypothetical protein